MNATTAWRIPASVLRWMYEVPANAPVAMLLRHSVRDALPPDQIGYDLPITQTGADLARELGNVLGKRLCSLHTSPLARCRQTAKALLDGAGSSVAIQPDRMLGDPGVYVVDAEAAWPNWEEKGQEGIIEHLIRENASLPGMAPAAAAARTLVRHMLTKAGGDPGFHIFVTHDLLVTATAARMLGVYLKPDDWPWYLEAAFFWRENGCLVIGYRDFQRQWVDHGICMTSTS